MDTLPIDRVVYKNVILHCLKYVRSRYIIRSLSDQCTDSKSQRQQVVTNSQCPFPEGTRHDQDTLGEQGIGICIEGDRDLAGQICVGTLYSTLSVSPVPVLGGEVVHRYRL